VKLRDYQEEVVGNVLGCMKQGFKSSLNAIFTGAGKTIIFSTLAKRIAGRTLIIAPLRELVWQAADKARTIVGEDVDIEMAEYSAPTGNEFVFPSKVVIACKQTLLSGRKDNKRYRKFTDFELVIVDEAHMQCSDAVIEMLTYFQEGGAHVSGFTATPFRMDSKPMLKGGACDFTNASQQNLGLTGE
jgi:superfamily II DNA or RNA helicase